MKSKFFNPRFWFFLLACVGVFWFSPESLFSQTARSTTSIKSSSDAPSTTQPQLGALEASRTPSLITQAVALTLMSLLPFIIMILTSFMKIVIVLSLLRNALGVQQAPPNQILNGVAFMLSLFIMYPTVLKMYGRS